MKSALSQSQQLFLLALVFCVILPHALFQPIWLTVALFGLWGWRFGVVIKKLPSGAQWIKYGLLVGVLIGFVLTYSGGVSTEGMVALLNAGLILKLIETHDRRAAWIVVGVSILTSAAFFLRNQSVIGALYILLMIAFVLFVMVRLNADHQSIGVSCKKAFLVLAQALPITVLLFIILPRIPPLWAVPASGSAVTGVAERFSPGQISNLTRTSDVAFRVKFDGNLPSRANLYWRMMTYSEFDGVEWVADKPTERLGQHVIAEIKREEQAQRYRYEVLTQPNGVGALPLLSTPVSASSGLMDTFLRSNNTLRRDRPFIEGALYQAESVLSAHWPAESGRALSLALRMPQGNPRLVALAKELARNSATQEELIAALLDIYRQAFSYSLSPLPTRGSNSVDQFLFETQEGFCGHFAGATALVLRAAGIPARV
ncbi:MAG: transglutaminaseTgpA domain-containing protein, partial [Pontibacterium sp.]